MSNLTQMWAITPLADDDLLRAAASITGVGAVTLLTSTVAPNGCGYKLVITSTGDERTKTFTIVGIKVGDQTGAYTTEIVTGPNATTASSTNFYTYVSSITMGGSGASAGDVKIGTVGSLALPRTRIRAVYYVGSTNAGTIAVNKGSSTGVLQLQLDTPALSTAGAFTVAPLNVLVGESSKTDMSVVTLTQVTKATLFCG